MISRLSVFQFPTLLAFFVDEVGVRVVALESVFLVNILAS